MTDDGLVERLAAHRLLGSVPREQLEWLAAHGTLRRFAKGEQISSSTEPLRAMFVVLSGHAVILVDRGSGPRKVVEWYGGEVSGLLPYSRLTHAPGVVVVEEPVELLAVDREHFPEMISRCHEVTAILVHAMVDRARTFTRSDLQNEKMVSLGRLSAGFAHELNNPASALARSATEFAARLSEVASSSQALGALQLSPEQLALIGEVCVRCGDPAARAALSPLERAEREEAVSAWLARHGLGTGVAEALVETEITNEVLDRLERGLGEAGLGFALRSIGASCRATLLAGEVQAAASRIHSLVAAIKGFTYMDQSDVPAPVAVGRGLADTLAVLAGKARRKSVTVTLQVDEDLPPVEGFGGELNQVWANLIDNAIDAVPESGRVEVSAARENGSVVVRVVDDGPGVPERLREQIFDPFFTTKPQGQGTGLGLDIARRVVGEHDGVMELVSRPGRTEFRVTLPAA